MMMPIRYSLFTLMCKFVVLCTMLYNLLLSPLLAHWGGHDNEDDQPQSSPWWASRDKYHTSPALNILNSTKYEVNDINESTIHSCIYTSTSESFPICVYPPKMDKYISAALLSEGVWEPFITPLFEKALGHYRNATVIDVGANIGYYSLLAANAGHQVISVEPSLTNLRHLQKASYSDWRLPARITMLHNAVYKRRQNVTLTSSADNQGGLWIEQMALSATSPPQRPVITTILMDDICSLLPPHAVVILKVDIEGFECTVITSGQKLLQEFHIPYIFMEWGKMFKMRHRADTPCPTQTMDHIASLLTHLGYVAVEVKTGFVLDSDRSATNWKIGDLYWRHKLSPELQGRY